MARLYSVKNWDTLFETAESRRVKGPLSWVATPTKHDGLGFRRIMRLPNAGDVYTAWQLILQVAAKCTVRGVLADENGPFDAADLHDKTGFPTSMFEQALSALSGNKIGWISVADSEDATDELRLHNSTGQDSTEQDNAATQLAASSGDAGPAPPDAPSEFVFPTTGKGRSEWALPQSKLAEYIAGYPALDVIAELRKARQWCRDNPRNRKTAGGMLAFLTGWLNRATNRGGARIESGRRKLSDLVK